MGNNGSGAIDAELRALAHQLNAHLNSKSAILYQISLLKLKLNSRGSFADPSDKSEGIEKEIKEVPEIVKSILEVSEKKAIDNRLSPLSASEFSNIFQRKNEEIENLERVKEEEMRALEPLIQEKDQIERKYSEYATRVAGVKNLSVEEAKKVSNDLAMENERLMRIVEELKNKESFLINKKTELMMRRGNKRKTFLGFAILNQNAMDLRSKCILKQEIIKTIQQTTAEQKENMVSIERKRTEGGDEQDEASLIRELALNNQKIIDLEWELKGEKDKSPKPKPNSSEFSLNFGSADRVASENDEEYSFSSSLQDMINGLGDYKQDRETLAEENSKLRKLVSENFTIRGRPSPAMGNI